MVLRLKQWHRLDASSLSELKAPLWLGGLMVPDAFLAASKQAVAKVSWVFPAPMGGGEVCVVCAGGWVIVVVCV